jgi:TolA-binding protein
VATAAPRPAAAAPSKQNRTFVAIGAIVAVAAALGAGTYFALRSAAQAPDTAVATDAGAAPAAAPAGPTSTPAASASPAAPPAATAPIGAPATPVPPLATPPVKPVTGAVDPNAKPGDKRPAVPAVPGMAAAKPGPNAAKEKEEADAAQRLEVARAKLANRLVDQAVVDLKQIITDYPNSKAAMDAAFLAADSLEKAGKVDDAMAAYVEFDKRFTGDSRVADSKLRRAGLLSRGRNARQDLLARELLGEVARDFPGTPQAKQALIQKRAIESQRRQIRETDPVTRKEVPAVLVTLRTLADQFPSDPETMVALNALGNAYLEMDEYQAAAEIWTRMASSFPPNPMEVWFRLGELYERRMNDPERARAAYAQVPPNSPRYADAQRRVNRK